MNYKTFTQVLEKNISRRIVWHLLFVPFFVMLLIQCSSNKEQEEDIKTTKVTGQLINLWEYNLEVSLGDSTFLVDISEDGSFDFELDELKEPATLAITNHNTLFELYVLPGEKLDVSADMNQFLYSAEFIGPAAAYNRYLSGKILSEASSPKVFEIVNLDEEEFMKQVDSQKVLKLEFLESFRDSVSSSFFNKMEGNILYGWANELLTYQNLKSKATAGGYSPGDSLVDILQSFSLNETRYLDSYRFKNFIFDQVQLAVNNRLATITFPKEHADSITLALSLTQLNSFVTNDTVKRASIADILSYYLTDLRLGTATYFMEKYRGEIPKNQLSLLDRKYALLQPMAVNSPAPTFSLIDQNGDTISLEDLGGSILYIDFWASWCAPCIKELPSIKSLEETFEGQPVQFVGISIDEEYDDWQNALKKHDFTGIQLFAGGAESETAEAYLIEAIPHYVLIDDYGSIINPNASRPRLDAREQIADLLDKVNF